MLRNTCLLIVLLLLVCNGSTTAQTINGRWQKADSLALIEGGIFSAASDLVAYYIGPDKGWKTVDGGYNWDTIAFPQEIGVGPISIFTQGESNVLLLQQRLDITVPMLVRSTDKGTTWQIVKDSAIFDNIRTATMWSPTGMHIISVDGSGVGRSYISNDGGATFSEGRADAILNKYITDSLTGTKRYTISVAWSDSLNGILSLAPRNISNPSTNVLVTSDAGSSWQEVKLPKRNDTIPVPGLVYTIPGTPYFWVNVTELTLPGWYYLSTDRGETWRASTAINRPLEFLSPLDTSLVWGLFSASTYRELNFNKTFVAQGPESQWSQIPGIPSGGQGGSRSIEYFKFFAPTKGWAAGTRVNAPEPRYYYIYRFIEQSGVASPSATSELSLSPMPVSNVLHIKHNGVVTFRVIDLMGKDVSTQVLTITSRTNEISLDVSRLEAGVYTFLAYTSGGAASSCQFIKN